ncbi:MAG TPA: biotin/lipoyl-containing protein, partial [Pyrinomonadaceae bacterium]|nr:biotin/lipoyl-containing protein [Pyrinomonadaceae bacterium]
MATQVVMPKLSPTMEEGQLSRWLKKEGDKVTVGEPIVEIDTDKATMEAQALAEGVLRKILVEEGTTVPLGQVIAIIGAPDEDISGLVSEASSGQSAAANKERIEESVQGRAYGAPDELAQVKPDGGRTQETIQGRPLDGDVGGRAGETQPQPTGQRDFPAPRGEGDKSAASQGSGAPPQGDGRGQAAGEGGRLVV